MFNQNKIKIMCRESQMKAIKNENKTKVIKKHVSHNYNNSF